MNKHSLQNATKTNLAKQVRDFIQMNLQEDLSLSRLEKTFHYSKYYLNRVFEKEYNETIYKYIKRNRMSQAAIKLVSTSRPIIDIAYEAGYDSQQAFSQAFQQMYVIPPYAFRKKNMARISQTKFYAYALWYSILQMKSKPSKQNRLV